MKAILLIVIMIVSTAQAQINLAGKSYTALIRSSCKEFKDGGCTINTYCTLTFEKEKVTVSYSTKATCTDKKREKTYEGKPEEGILYNWTTKNEQVHIENFIDYGDLLPTEGKLVGKKEVNGLLQDLDFVEVLN